MLENGKMRKEITKEEWKRKAKRVLKRIDNLDKLESEPEYEESPSDDEQIEEKFKTLAKKAEKCVQLWEIENLVNEAESYYYYQDNELYDKLIEMHINSSEYQKMCKKSWENKEKIEKKKLKKLLEKVINQGIVFDEAIDLSLFLSIKLEIKEAKKKKLSLREISDLLIKIEKIEMKEKNIVDSGTIKKLRMRRSGFLKIKDRVKKEFKSVKKCENIDDKGIKPILRDMKKYKMNTVYHSKMLHFVRLADVLRKIHLTLYPHEIDNKHKKLNLILDQCNEKLKNLKILFENSKDLFLKRFTPTSEKECLGEVKMLKNEIETCKEFLDCENFKKFSKFFKLIIWKSRSLRAIRNKNHQEEIVRICLDDIPSEEEKSEERGKLEEIIEIIENHKSKNDKIKEKFFEFWKMNIDNFLTSQPIFEKFLQEIEDKNTIDTPIFNKEKLYLKEIKKIFSKESVSSNDLKQLKKHEYICIVNSGYDLFQEVSETTKNSIKLDKLKSLFLDIESKFKRSWKNHNELNLRKILSLPRFSKKMGKSSIEIFGNLNNKVKQNFKKFVTAVSDNISILDETSLQIHKLERDYPNETLVKFYLNELCIDMIDEEDKTREFFENSIKEFENIMENYSKCLIKDLNLEEILKKKNTILKAVSLMADIPFKNLRRGIGYWQSSITELKNIEGVDVSELVKEMRKKMEKAEQMLMEAHKMRQFENQVKRLDFTNIEEFYKSCSNLQTKMLQPQRLVEVIRSYRMINHEIEINDTMDFLNKVTKTYEDCKENIRESSSLNKLEEVKSILSTLPLQIEKIFLEQVELKIEKSKDLREKFLKALTNDKKLVIKNMKSWESWFSELDLKVKEWEEFKQEMENSKQFLEELPQNLSNCQSLDQLKILKQKYNNSKFEDNIINELNFFSKRLHLIQIAYEKKMFFEEPQEIHRKKILNLADLDQIDHEINHYGILSERNPEKGGIGLKIDLTTMRRFSFLKKLKIDIEKHLKESLANCESLYQLDMNLKWNPLVWIVDVKLFAENLKKNLEIESRKKFSADEASRINFKSTFESILRMNSAFTFQQKEEIDISKITEKIEKEIFDMCIVRAVEYSEYTQKVYKLFHKLLRFPAISIQLRRKKFKLSLIDQLFYKSDSEINSLNSHLYKTLNETGQYPSLLLSSKRAVAQRPSIPYKKRYNYYNIFKGNLTFALKNKKSNKKCENCRVYSCAQRDILAGYSALYNDLVLSAGVKVHEFQRYIERAILNDNYVVTPLWLKMEPKNEEKAAIYFKKNKLVASVQYSKTCKIFMLAKEHLRPEWLKALEFNFAKNLKHEEKKNLGLKIVGFLVLKMADHELFEDDFREELINPISVKYNPEKVKFFKIFSIYNKIKEKEIKSDELIDKDHLMKYRDMVYNNGADFGNNLEQNRNFETKETHMRIEFENPKKIQKFQEEDFNSLRNTCRSNSSHKVRRMQNQHIYAGFGNTRGETNLLDLLKPSIPVAPLKVSNRGLNYPMNEVVAQKIQKNQQNIQKEFQNSYPFKSSKKKNFPPNQQVMNRNQQYPGNKQYLGKRKFMPKIEEDRYQSYSHLKNIQNVRDKYRLGQKKNNKKKKKRRKNGYQGNPNLYVSNQFQQQKRKYYNPPPVKKLKTDNFGFSQNQNLIMNRNYDLGSQERNFNLLGLSGNKKIQRGGINDQQNLKDLNIVGIITNAVAKYHNSENE